MATEQNDKSQRLHVALKEAIQPVLAKMNTLEQEVASLKEEQKELKKWLQEKNS